MAPELRKRKVVVQQETVATVPKVKKAAAAKSKRKAGDDASPVTVKKQKAIKKTVVQPESDDTPAEAPTPCKSEVAVVEDVIEVESAAGDESASDDDNVQALALRVDSEDADGAPAESTFEPGQDVGAAPVAKDSRKSRGGPRGPPGVVYIGRIPHGFYEKEMRKYFSQFGRINQVRLSRNKKTGASKHFAFIEFADETTAEIVAKTMDNYLLFGHILKCKVVPKEQVHEELFKGANRTFKKVPWNKMERKRLQRPLTEASWEGRVARETKKRGAMTSKLQKLGYEFDAPQIKDVPAAPALEAPAEPLAVEAAPVEAEEVKAPEAVITKTVTVVEEPVADEPAEVKTISATKVVKGKAKGKGKKVKA